MRDLFRTLKNGDRNSQRVDHISFSIGLAQLHEAEYKESIRNSKKIRVFIKTEMQKNRVKTDSRLLADIVLNPRSNAYKELCDICTDENGLQSDDAAARLRDELKSILVELLKDNFKPVNAKLVDNVQAPASVSVRPISGKKMLRSLNTHFTKIRIGKNAAYFVEELPDTATPEQLIYGVLRRSLKNDDIARLELCEHCQKLFYRKSLKRNFCSDTCRITFHNHSDKRKQHYIKGKWYP